MTFGLGRGHEQAESEYMRKKFGMGHGQDRLDRPHPRHLDMSPIRSTLNESSLKQPMRRISRERGHHLGSPYHDRTISSHHDLSLISQDPALDISLKQPMRRLSRERGPHLGSPYHERTISSHQEGPIDSTTEICINSKIQDAEHERRLIDIKIENLTNQRNHMRRSSMAPAPEISNFAAEQKIYADGFQ